MTRVRGLDISWCQGAVDFDALPSWVRFVVVKVSEGASGQDPNRARNLLEARKRGLRTFVYHFFRTAQNAEQQAENLWRAIGDTMVFPFIDFETLANGVTAVEAVADCLLLKRAIEARFGRPPGLYTYPWFAQGVLGTALSTAAELAECPLWLADYRGGEDPPEDWKPFIPRPWRHATFVQTSGDKSTRVPGIVGPVDHDYFDGSEQELAEFLGLPKDDQLEPDAPIIHPPVYGWVDEPDSVPPPSRPGT